MQLTSSYIMMKVNRLHVGHRHAIYVTLSLEALGIDGFETSENKGAIKTSESLFQPNPTLKPPLSDCTDRGMLSTTHKFWTLKAKDKAGKEVIL